MNINLEDVLPKVIAQMEKNVRSGAAAQGLTQEEIDATWVLNRKKVIEDAQKLATFIGEAFFDVAPAEQLPL